MSPDLKRLQQQRRVLFAAGVGTFVEFFDYASYAYLVTTIAVVFFPAGNRATAVIQAFALFATSFAMRPIGALFWGHFGDRIGRRHTLALTIIGIGFATFAIGFLPPYSSIGLYATILLVMIRLFQSFCTAGEYSGAAVLVGEFAPTHKRARYVSVVPISCALGFLLASGMVSVLHGSLSQEQMLSWGWRVPFVLGGALTIVGWYIRGALEETPAFAKVLAQESRSEAPVCSLLRRHLSLLVRLLCVMGMNAAGYYLVLGYMPTYLERETGLGAAQAGSVTTIALIVYLPLLYAFAALSDRIGRRPVLLASCVAFILLSYPAFYVLETGGYMTALLVQLLLVAMFSLNDAVFATFFVESFPPSVRFSGFALPFNLGVAVFGGTAPLLAAWLIERTGSRLMPALVMIIIAALSLIALLVASERVPSRALASSDLLTERARPSVEPRGDEDAC